MPTPKSLREAPNRIFENYVLTLSVDNKVGLTKTPQEKFSQVPGNAGKSGQSAGLSGDTNIGFPFVFDGITYNKFNVSVDGWIVLVDPTSPFSAADVLFDVSSPYLNVVKPTFSANHAFFAVWWSNLVNASNAETLGTDGYRKGIEPPLARVNPRKFGIQYCNDTSPFDGRRLIVRWYSTSLGAIKNRIEFEIVFYENGKIEYRYAPRNQITISESPANESATIGVFMPNGTYRFRDFSYEMGYDKFSRSQYRLGGSVSGSYIDSVYDSVTVSYIDVPYGGNLTLNNNWPGQTSSGAIFTFQPPNNRKKILPRLTLREKDSKITLPTVARTGDTRSGKDYSSFDDRKSISYITRDDINYPTTLPRFYAPTSLSQVENQDLFLDSIVTTGSINKQATEQYLESNFKESISPFTENKLFENDPGADSDSFFTVGSSIEDVGEGFKQPLKSKTQIRLSYRVDHKTTLFGASSSVYYFNSKIGRWQYPTSSFTYGYDIAEPYSEVINKRTMEIDRGFNACGFNISSGSSANRVNPDFGTDPAFTQYLTRQSEIELLIKQYDKSIQVNQEYNAINDETITIPINQPFLLEKAVVEIPIEAGPGWFYDKTQCILPNTTGYPVYFYSQDGTPFDIGGPGLTFSLYNQIPLGKTSQRRDLILSGTVTHDSDNSAKIAYYQFLYGIGSYPNAAVTAYSDVYQCTPRGFLAYGTPAGIIKGNNDYFTGSAKFKCVAAVSNGSLIRDTVFVDQDPIYHLDKRTSAVTEMFKTPTFKLNKGGEIQDFYSSVSPPNNEGDGCRETILLNVNNFSRSGIGFQPSGRSILGKEYVTTQGKKYPDEYDNQFYLYKDSIVKLDHGSTGAVSEGPPEDVDTIINDFANNYNVMIMTQVIQRQSTKVSPYLLLPNDKLVLSISKSRPAFLSTEAPDPFTMNQIQHDIKLTTGSINITLYGSLVSNGKEFHDTLNQPLASDAIHEVVVGETKT